MSYWHQWGLIFILHLSYELASRWIIPKHHREMYAAHLVGPSVKIALLTYAAIPVLWGITFDAVGVWQAFFGSWLFVFGGALVIWARRVNYWFLPIVVQPPYRCKEGPYEWVNHPGYIGMALMAIGMACILNSAICVVPTIAYLGILCWRAMDEDELLGNL